MKKLFKRISACAMAVAVAAVNMTSGNFFVNTSADLDLQPVTVPAVSSGQPFVTKINIKSENSLLRFLHSGIFGKEKLSVTVYAKDDSGNPISNINLYNSDSTEIDGGSAPAYDAENDVYFVTWLLEKGDYSLSAQPFTEHSAGGFYSIDLSKSNNDEVNEKEYQSIVVNGAEDGRRILVEDSKPEIQVYPVHADISGNYVNISTIEKYSDGSFYSSKDGDKVWTNGAFEYLVTASDGGSGIYSISHKLNTSADYTAMRTSSEDIQADFSVPVSVPADTSGEKSISVRAEDNSGNVTDTVNSVPVEIDRTAPSITIEKAEIIAENGSSVGSYTENSWTNKRVRITVSAEDSGSGADSIKVNSAGEKVSLNNVSRNGKKVTYIYIVDTDFMGSITFSAYDKVNNKSKDISYKVRSETTPPSITNFDINQNINIQNYGFSIENDAVVSISAYDIEPYWSGIDYIELGFVDMQAMDAEYNYSESSIVKSEPVYVSQNSAVQTCNFSVGAGFKGQILARAADCAGNVGKWRTLESLVANSQELHDESSYRGIVIGDAPYTDIDGNPLYSSDQKVSFIVKDSHAGIREIKWYVRTSQGIVMGSDTVSDFSSDITDGWKISRKRDVITEAEKEITVGENENNIEIGLCFSDNAGFETPWEVKYISIDKTKPEIVSFSFDDNSDDKIFNKNRKAVITVRERNISTDNVLDIAISNQLNKTAVPYTVSDWELISAKSNRDEENLYRMTISFNADAEYKFSLNVRDLTGKTADKPVKADFTIDKTAPVIEVSYDNNNAVNKVYYNADRKATIKITEHNFRSDDVKYTLTAFAEDNITKIKENQIIPQKLKWTQNPNNKDEWTAQINFNKEGKFALSISCADKAGNSKSFNSGTFYIDKTAPKIEQTFTNGKSRFATNKLIVPKVTVSDYNPDSEKYQVIINKIDMDGNTDKNFDCTSSDYTPVSAKKPAVYEFVYNIFAELAKSDGIYDISIFAEDMAGNKTAVENLNLSINRKGSTFELINEEAKDAVEKYNNDRMPQQERVDVEIKEINVSKRVGDSVITVTRDNKKARILTEDDYTIEEGKSGENDNGWYETTYKINKSNFEDDGVYIITIETNDETGNTNSNSKSTVQFSVDSTPPEVVISGVRDNANLKEDEVNLRITFSDRNLYSLDSLHGDDMIVKINNDTYNFDDLDKIGAKISNDDAGSIVMLMTVKADSKNSKNNISASLRDRADNVSEFSDSEITFRLSATFLMRHGWIAIIVAVLILLVLGIDVFFITKKVKRD